MLRGILGYLRGTTREELAGAYEPAQVVIDGQRYLPKARDRYPGCRVLVYGVDYQGQVAGADNGVARRYPLFLADQDYLILNVTTRRTDASGEVETTDQLTEYYVAEQDVVTNFLTMDPVISGAGQDKELAINCALAYMHRGDRLYQLVQSVVIRHVYRTKILLVPVDRWTEPFVTLGDNIGVNRQVSTAGAVPAAGAGAPLLYFDSWIGYTDGAAVP